MLPGRGTDAYTAPFAAAAICNVMVTVVPCFTKTESRNPVWSPDSVALELTSHEIVMIVGKAVLVPLTVDASAA